MPRGVPKAGFRVTKRYLVRQLDSEVTSQVRRQLAAKIRENPDSKIDITADVLKRLAAKGVVPVPAEAPAPRRPVVAVPARRGPSPVVIAQPQPAREERRQPVPVVLAQGPVEQDEERTDIYISSERFLDLIERHPGRVRIIVQ
jgi:hypothetical protein